MNHGPLESLLSIGLILGLMGGVVLVFRLLIRRPVGVSRSDPPSVRTVAAFTGHDADFFADDDETRPYVGLRLFRMLCDGLVARYVDIKNRGTIQFAQRAECALGEQRYTLVLEWLESRWLVSVEWAAQTRAERRHLALTHEVYSPDDSPELRRLLTALDEWLHSHPGISDVCWYRKEDWIAENTSDPSAAPIRA